MAFDFILFLVGVGQVSQRGSRPVVWAPVHPDSRASPDSFGRRGFPVIAAGGVSVLTPFSHCLSEQGHVLPHTLADGVCVCVWYCSVISHFQCV